MKEMTALVIIALILAFVIVVMGCIAMNYRHLEKMAELGYVEVAYPGSTWPHWEKAK